MSNAPDRIMVSVDFERLGRIKVKTSCVTVGLVGVPEPFEPARYLLSTPAREHADELVDALEEAGRKLLAYVGVCKGDKELTEANLPAIHSVLTKIKETSNE